jgi:hypothetical protein
VTVHGVRGTFLLSVDSGGHMPGSRERRCLRHLDYVRGIETYLCVLEKYVQREWVAIWLRIVEVPLSGRDNCNQPSLLKVLRNSVNAKFALSRVTPVCA